MNRFSHYLGLSVTLAVVSLASCTERPDSSASGWACATNNDCAPNASCLSGRCFAADSTPCFDLKPSTCDDGLACTDSTCDLSRNLCVHARMPGTCAMDGTSCGCTGLDDPSRCIVGVCDPQQGCVENPIPAGMACGAVAGTCVDGSFSGDVCDGTMDGCSARTLACTAVDDTSVGLCVADSGCLELPKSSNEMVSGDWLLMDWNYKDGRPGAVPRHLPKVVTFQPDGVARSSVYLESAKLLNSDIYTMGVDGEVRFDKQSSIVLDGSLKFAVTPWDANNSSQHWIRLPKESFGATVFAGHWRGFMTRVPLLEGAPTEVHQLILDIGPTGLVTRALTADAGDATKVVQQYTTQGAVQVTGGARFEIAFPPTAKGDLVLEGWIASEGRTITGTVSVADSRVGVFLLVDTAAPDGPSRVDGRYILAGPAAPPMDVEGGAESGASYKVARAAWSEWDDATGLSWSMTQASHSIRQCDESPVSVNVDPATRRIVIDREREGWSEHLEGWFLPGNPAEPRIPMAVLAHTRPPIPLADPSWTEGLPIFRGGINVMIWTPLRTGPPCSEPPPGRLGL